MNPADLPSRGWNEITSVDFAGPLYVKGGGKAWVCPFACASLSADTFLECLQRFIARRGRMRNIFYKIKLTITTGLISKGY